MIRFLMLDVTQHSVKVDADQSDLLLLPLAYCEGQSDVWRIGDDTQ
jgi:hypothetical protein